jgi:hypothetical protein
VANTIHSGGSRNLKKGVVRGASKRGPTPKIAKNVLIWDLKSRVMLKSDGKFLGGRGAL